MMTLEEIKAKSKYMYDNLDDINSMSEVKQAARDVLSMLFYTTDHIIELAEEEKKKKA